MFVIRNAFFTLSMLILPLFDAIATQEHQSLRRTRTNIIESHRSLQQQFMHFEPTSDVKDYSNID